MSDLTNIQLKRKYETLYLPRIKKTIDAKFNDIATIVKNRGVNAAIAALNVDLTNPELTAVINQLYSTVGVRYANITMRGLKQAERQYRKPQKDEHIEGLELLSSMRFANSESTSYTIEAKAGGSFGFNETWVAWILNYLREHLIENITFNVNRTTREHLLNVLSQSIEQGLGIDETVRLINTDTFSESQAARIARTEVNMATNAGTLAAGETYEYQMKKEWVSVHDNRTRGVHPDDHASHIGLDGVIIDFDDVFTDPRNGDKLKSPGDPKASAASVINCRCQLVLTPKRDERGRLIPKLRTTTVIYPNQNRRRQPVITI